MFDALHKMQTSLLALDPANPAESVFRKFQDLLDAIMFLLNCQYGFICEGLEEWKCDQGGNLVRVPYLRTLGKNPSSFL